MIDWARVTELRDEIGAEDFGDVVALFLEEANDVVGKLPGFTDAKSLESGLHFLKGSALNLGFSELARLCQEGERNAAGGLIPGNVAAVIACYDVSKACFDAGLPKLAAPIPSPQ